LSHLGPVEEYWAGSGEGRATALVVHDWFGLLPHVRAYCDRLAHHGFDAVAPDLYHGQTATTADEAQALAGRLGLGVVRAELDRLLVGCRRHGGAAYAIGFSVGGWFALDLAARADLDAVVAYYAIHESPRAITAPVLLHLAETDDWETSEAPEQFFDGLATSARSVKCEYEGTRHSFTNADVSAYDETAEGEAFAATVAFLRSREPGGRPWLRQVR